MNSVLARLGSLEQRVGRGGLGALLVLTGAAAFYLLTVLPLQSEVAELRAEAGRLEGEARRVARAGAESAGPQSLQAFYGSIPDANEAPGLLNDIFGTAARAGVRLEASHYRVTEDKGTRLLRYEITLPVNGSYPQVRSFVAFALAYVPSLSLDSLLIRKDKIDEGEVKAEIKMTLYLERA